MAVSIGLSTSASSQDADYSAGVGLDDDAYYWHLYPYFERIWRQTGQMVDPYGDAVFDLDGLTLLRAALGEALADVNRLPPEWEVEIGWRIGTPVVETVNRVHAQKLLADLIRLAEEAHHTGKSLVCWGD